MRGKPKHRDHSWQRSGAGTEQHMLFIVAWEDGCCFVYLSSAGAVQFLTVPR